MARGWLRPDNGLIGTWYLLFSRAEYLGRVYLHLNPDGDIVKDASLYRAWPVFPVPRHPEYSVKLPNSSRVQRVQ